jgi:hypothetical protein
LLQALEVEEETSLFDVIESVPKKKTYQRSFVHPAPTVKKPSSTNQTIQFSRPRVEIEAMKDFFGVSSARQAGEEAWEYVLNEEEL